MYSIVYVFLPAPISPFKATCVIPLGSPIFMSMNSVPFFSSQNTIGVLPKFVSPEFHFLKDPQIKLLFALQFLLKIDSSLLWMGVEKILKKLH